MKRLIAGLVLAGIVGSGAAAVRGQEVVEEIVAVVNDDIITLSEYKLQFSAAVAQLRSQQLPAEEFDKQYQLLKKEMVNLMITELLLLQKARELDINVSEQLKSVLEKIKAENNMSSDADLRRAVEQQGMSYEAWLKQYEEGLMRQGVLYAEVERSIVLDDAEVVQYYKKHPEEFTTPTEYNVHAVYLAADRRSADETEALKAEVDAKLKAGGAFADVAGELADPPMKDAKGSLGTFKAGELDKTLEAAVEKLKGGQTSPWVNTKNGWYLLRLEERKDSFLRSFDDARREVEEKLYNAKRETKTEAYLKTLRERSYVKILNANPVDY